MRAAGPLTLVAGAFALSAGLRLAPGLPGAAAAVGEVVVPPEAAEALIEEIGARRAALGAREAELEREARTRRAALDAREAELARAEGELEAAAEEVRGAAEALSGLLSEAEGVGGRDVERLASAYAAMRPGDAAALFAVMEAGFAAGFLRRMPADAAAGILAAMAPEDAYAVSAVVAGRAQRLGLPPAGDGDR
ncbi:flagellar motility protein MotE (MotC chaperone) [Hasllibacter halocynthiae]|uniref:Flagellar motility protein MotE (MotC chaperone) n=1 Tax=Hasllibacter halocynthiae TaxID=595589 RepID=A0A2T0X2N7_9RHOB|nr:hypothetical protein [Hasllibacter halocynthiae]PRY93201.1 flagellar motility protein MotE (MotC chaperone) [Hasllibacter halocynthiae]